MKVNSGPIHDEISFAYNQKLQRQKYKAYDLRRSMGNMTLKSQVTPCFVEFILTVYQKSPTSFITKYPCIALYLLENIQMFSVSINGSVHVASLFIASVFPLVLGLARTGLFFTRS